MVISHDQAAVIESRIEDIKEVATGGSVAVAAEHSRHESPPQQGTKKINSKIMPQKVPPSLVGL
jgi:hypothetical protein